MARVAELLEDWAGRRGESSLEHARWRAAAYLHDTLREEDPEVIRPELSSEFQKLPGKILHGPGAAIRLAREGVEDQELLHAIRFHTLGSAGFKALGLALYAADFLEPGRKRRRAWRERLRRRAAGDLQGVVREILADRIHYLLKKGRPVHPKTMEFWNRFSEGEPWASASEC